MTSAAVLPISCPFDGSHVVSPEGLQKVLTEGCNLQEDQAEHQTNGDHQGEEELAGDERAKSLRYAILIHLQGDRVAQSEGLDAQAADLTAGLVSATWRQQFFACQRAAGEDGPVDGSLKEMVMM